MNRTVLLFIRDLWVRLYWVHYSLMLCGCYIYCVCCVVECMFEPLPLSSVFTTAVPVDLTHTCNSNIQSSIITQRVTPLSCCVGNNNPHGWRLACTSTSCLLHTNIYFTACSSEPTWLKWEPSATGRKVQGWEWAPDDLQNIPVCD